MTKNEAVQIAKEYKGKKVTVECFLPDGTPCSPPTGMNAGEVLSLLDKAACVHACDQNPHWSCDLMLCMAAHEIYVNTPNEPD